MSTGLFLITARSFHFLADRLTERKFRFGELHIDFVAAKELADSNFKLLVTDSVK